MKCQKCGKDFPEAEIHESHDVPKYVFNGDKNLADKHGRHWLCKKCHDTYEKMVFAAMVKPLPVEIKAEMVKRAQGFARSYFKEVTKEDDTPIR